MDDHREGPNSDYDPFLPPPDLDYSDDGVLDEAQQDTTTRDITYEITSFGADMDVDGLVRRLDRAAIAIPAFQRDFVWTLSDASRFIESLLLGLPVPGIFLAVEQDTNNMLVIDGQQRLRSLQFFISGLFNPKSGDTRHRVFRLKRVNSAYEGKSFNDLDEASQRRLLDSLIHATIIKQDSPRDDNTAVFHVFERLNTGGRRLSPQEIRAAVYHGSMLAVLDRLNQTRAWRSIYGRPSARLKDQELILRFLALRFGSEKYEPPMTEFLNVFCKTHRNADGAVAARFQESFEAAVQTLHDSVGDRAFRLGAQVNAAVFDAVMVGISRRLESRAEAPAHGFVAEAYFRLLEDSRFIDVVSSRTSNEASVRARLSMATSAFEVG